MTVLVTGVSGQLAHLVCEMLRDRHELVGADVRPLPAGRSFPGEFHCVRYTQRRMAEVFRRHRPRALVHLGRLRGSEVSSTSFRFTQNVLGTRNLIDLCIRYGVKRFVVLGTFHVYGAHQHNHVGIREDAPLRASLTFPQIADAVELDHAVTGALWRHRELETVLLRPCHIVGPSLNNLTSRLFRLRAVPTLLGYDPMLQFVHERDCARAICLALHGDRVGVYNVAGEGAVPYTYAIRLAGGRPVPVPHFLAYPVVGSLSRWRLLFPKHLMDYFRYPTVVDDSLFRADFGYAPQFTIVETLASVGRQQVRRKEPA